MKPLKVEVKIIDRDRILETVGKYYADQKLVIAKKGRFSREKLDFVCDPEHIITMVGSKPKYAVYVDMATRQSVNLKSDKPIEWNVANQLDYHTERTFWKALMESHKIPLSTLVITLLAGMGIYLIFTTILRMFGFHV